MTPSEQEIENKDAEELEFFESFPYWMSRDALRERNPNLRFTEEQWSALARGANIIDDASPDATINGWWVLEAGHDDKNWIFLSGPEDVTGTTLTREMFDDDN